MSIKTLRNLGLFVPNKNEFNNKIRLLNKFDNLTTE